MYEILRNGAYHTLTNMLNYSTEEDSEAEKLGKTFGDSYNRGGWLILQDLSKK